MARMQPETIITARRETLAPVSLRRAKRLVEVWECKCERCGHQWDSRQKRPPTYCAGCRSRNWNSKARSYTRRAERS
jgi:predicted Zn-ribbon and HTH transcriptional regulator